jgi:hypothetical protein
MIQTIKDLLTDWNLKHGERVKMQHALVVLSLAGFVVAGLVGLLNYDASRAILRFSFYGLAIAGINAVLWALLYSFVVNKLPARRPTGRK